MHTYFYGWILLSKMTEQPSASTSTHFEINLHLRFGAENWRGDWAGARELVASGPGRAVHKLGHHSRR